SHSRASRINANCSCKNPASCENANASIARRPGAHVVLWRSNSRSLSNSSTSCALRLISSCLGSGRLLIARAGREVSGFPFSFSVFCFPFFEFRVSNFGFVLFFLQGSLQKFGRFCRFSSCMHHFAV